jgi:hypothetical protein
MSAMNPNNGTPLDYLNQIAPEQHKHTFLGSLRPVHYIAGGVVIVLLLVLIIGIAANGGHGSTNDMQHLLARLQTTTTIASDADKKIKSGSLLVINSNLDIYLANTNRDIVKPFKEVGVTSGSVPKKVTTDENGTSLSTKLEDARLNAIFDSTYAREMAYQTATILTLMKTIYQSTNNNDVKSFLQTAYKNLQPTQEAFDSFTTTTE